MNTLDLNSVIIQNDNNNIYTVINDECFYFYFDNKCMSIRHDYFNKDFRRHRHFEYFLINEMKITAIPLVIYKNKSEINHFFFCKNNEDIINDYEKQVNQFAYYFIGI